MKSISLTPSLHTLILISSVILVPLVIWPTYWDYTLSPKWFVLQICCILSLLFWLSTSNNIRFTHRILLPATLYVLWGFLSTLYATDPTLALLENAKSLTGLMFFLIVANHLTPQNQTRILLATTITGLIISLFGMAEYLGWQPVALPSSGQPSATLGFRNIAAMYLIQNIPLSVALLVHTRKTSVTWLSAFASACMICFLFYTRTRGAWLGLGLGIIVAVLFCYYSHKQNPISYANLKTKRLPFGMAFGFIIAFSFLPSQLEKRGPQSIDEKKTTVVTALQSITQSDGDRSRLIVWRHSLPLIQDHFLFGVGKGNWTVIYPQYDGGAHITFDAAPERPHNTPLQIFAELGLVGFGLFVWLCISVLQSVLQHLSTPSHRWIVIACLVSFLAIMFHGVFSFPLERLTPLFFFWLALGILAAQDQQTSQLPKKFQTPVLSLLLALSVIQLIFIWRFIQFDKHMYLARQFESKNQWNGVATQTQLARTKGQFHIEATYLGGYAHNVLGQFAKSMALYKDAMHTRPYDIQLLNGYGIAAQNIGQFQEAETHFKRATQLISPLPDVQYNLAGLYLQTQRPQLAIEAYQKVLEAESPALDIYHNLILAYLLNNTPQSATITFQKALALEPNPMPHIQFIEQFYKKHKQSQVALYSYQILHQNTSQPLPSFVPARMQQLNQTP